MDLATFRVMCPEFRTAGDSFVQAYLDEAAAELHGSELGGAYDAAHRLLAAHRMALSPYGQAARMVSENGSTTYQSALAELIGGTVLAAMAT